MLRTLAGATALVLVWGSLAAAQAPDEPQARAGQEQQQQSGQLQVGQQPGQQPGQQQTARGRITAIGDNPQASPGDAGNQALQPGQGSAQGIYITVTSRGGRRGAGQAQDQPGAATEPRPGQAQAGQGQMTTCYFHVTEQTQIDTSGAGQEPGQAGQAGQQEHRGLHVGQFVEVTYRPTQGQTQGGLASEDTPGRDSPVQTSQGQAGQGETVRGEATSVRVLPGPGQRGAGLDRPGQGATDPATGTDQPGGNP